MQEEFIHYLWKFKKLLGLPLHTTQHKSIEILDLGTHNHYSGPDFFNARVRIDGQLWAGNVEMHIKASDWYLHGHDDDPAYDSVILHVVWTHDAEINRRDGAVIPVLEVSQFVPNKLLSRYHEVFAVKSKQFINCENSYAQVDSFLKSMWYDKLFIERLQQRTIRIEELLKKCNNDWEWVFFTLLCRSFGTKVNRDAFEQLAQTMNAATVRKLARDAFQLESTLLGTAGLLEKKHQDRYFNLCVDEYAFARAKFNILPITIPMKFFRLRPANYPTIRLSQLAMLYHRSPMLFGEILLKTSRLEIHALFNVKAAQYWDTHHVWDKETSSRDKTLTAAFIDLLIINCIVPIKYAYSRFTGKDNLDELLDLIREVPKESNTIVKGFNKLDKVNNALESQALLQLKPNYCDKNNCLRCDIGVSLIKPV